MSASLTPPRRLPKYRNFGQQNNAPRRAVVPKVSNGLRGGASLPGAPVIARAKEEKLLPYPPMPAWWLASIGEWIVYDYLLRVKRWQENKDFYYQARVFLPQFYGSRDFTSADFVIDFGPTSAAGSVGFFQALVLDPITPFTHPSYGFDVARRAALLSQGYLLVFLEESDLLTRPVDVIEQGLRGIDVSSRGSNR